MEEKYVGNICNVVKGKSLPFILDVIKIKEKIHMC